MDPELATIHVHHTPESEAGAVQYNAGVLKFYLLQTIAAVQALHRAVANTLDYGKEKYKAAICAILDSYGKNWAGNTDIRYAIQERLKEEEAEADTKRARAATSQDELELSLSWRISI